MGDLNLFMKNGKKIIGVAIPNYKELIRALKICPKVPDVFIKPSTSYITEGSPIVIPKGFKVNQEIELGVVIGKTATKVCEEEAMDYVGGYCAGLDMTAVNILTEAKKKGGSWTIAKGFDTATAVSKFIPKSCVPCPYKLNLWCSVNGKERQNACTSDLFFNIAMLISFISKFITLEPNDMILTGSPPNFGPVKCNDIITGGIRDFVDIKFEVIDEQ